MIVMLAALVTWVLMDALRQKRQLEATALEKTVERGTQTEFNPVDQIMVPTNVYCSPGGACYHTSRKCAGLKNVPMDAIRRRRSCMCCVQRNGHREGCTAKRQSRCTWPGHLFFMNQCGQASWLPRRPTNLLLASRCGRQR